jgi:Holliday junction DNA helicase RuvB
LTLAPEGAREIARRSRGTPRIANRQLKWVRDFAQVHHAGKSVDAQVASEALALHRVDAAGLDPMDHAILIAVLDRFAGGPVGVESLAALLGEERETIEAVYEPFLVQSGYLERTPRGRMATQLCWDYFGRERPTGTRQGRLL